VSAAVSIGGPADRVDVSANDRLGGAVIEAAGAISRLLGHHIKAEASERD
jgi:DNA-binding IclR family transcriptional regulator